MTSTQTRRVPVERVRDLMTADPIVVREDQPLSAAVAVMTETAGRPGAGPCARAPAGLDSARHPDRDTWTAVGRARSVAV